jgi:hypothetical protein
VRSEKEASMAESASSGNGSFGKRVAHKALMPIVATAASAAAGYVAKKGPSFFEETVLPKLKDAAQGVGNAASDAPAKAKQAVDSAGDLAEGLTSRVRDTTTGAAGNGHSGGLSQDELERHVKERAEARAARRTSTRRAR